MHFHLQSFRPRVHWISDFIVLMRICTLNPKECLGFTLCGKSRIAIQVHMLQSTIGYAVLLTRHNTHLRKLLMDKALNESSNNIDGKSIAWPYFVKRIRKRYIRIEIYIFIQNQNNGSVCVISLIDFRERI